MSGGTAVLSADIREGMSEIVTATQENTEAAIAQRQLTVSSDATPIPRPTSTVSVQVDPQAEESKARPSAAASFQRLPLASTSPVPQKVECRTRQPNKKLGLTGIRAKPAIMGTILRLLHDNMQAEILPNGSITDPVHVRTRVKQGCVITPTLFSIFLAAMLQLTVDKLPAGVELNYRTSGNLFNLRRLQARSKTTPTSVVELQYADDACICAHTEAELQDIVDLFTEAYESMGLTINISKTKVLHQAVLATQHWPPVIKIHGMALDNVDDFLYLRSLLSTKAGIDNEIQHRHQSPMQPSAA
uniref:uncharacterized protein isoform X1 n=1 Tax=Pristiophorus japonicus TaxID=55135 RepID=UPI00398E68E3